METWIHNEILDGLSKLLCLSLERTPAADMIAGTAAMWVSALTDGVEWNEARDATRIRKAFVILAQTRTHWPAPLHFREVLPASTQLRLAGAGERPHDPPELLEAMTAAKQGDQIEKRAVSRDEGRKNANLAAIEADLQRHYGDRKQAAGGDA